MADKKISELTALTTPASDDVMPIVDTSTSITKKITLASMFGSVVASLVAAVGSTYSTGSASVRWLKGWFDSIAVTNIDGDVNVENVYPKTDNTYKSGSSTKQWSDVAAAQITLGGVARSTWPAAGSATVSMDDTYNNGSVIAVDNTDEVHKLTATKHFKLTDSTGNVVYFDVDGDGNVVHRSLNACENCSEQVQYPLPTSAYMLKAAADGSPATATNTDTEVSDAVTKRHTQNTDTGTTATSFKINSGGNEADLQTTGLTGDRDFTFPDLDTMIAGAAAMTQNGFEIIAY